MTHTTEEQRKVALVWLDTEPNAHKHFTKAGNEAVRQTLRDILQTPHVTVIEGLGAITNEDRTWYGVAGNIDPVAVPLKDFDKLMQCAREYLKLMKGNEK